MGTETQTQIQNQRAIFHQQIAIPRGAVDYVHPGLVCGQGVEDGSSHGRAFYLFHGGMQAGYTVVLFFRQCIRVFQADGVEPQGVAGFQLTEFPAVREDHGSRADETAEGGAVGTEDHRHVTGEVHRAHRVGIVVNVGGMHAGFAAVTASPAGLRADQANPGAAGVVMHLPVGGEEHGHVVVGKKVRGAMGAVNNAQGPVVAERGLEGVRHGC